MDDPTPRLFVDCDDTLLLYEDIRIINAYPRGDEWMNEIHPYGFWKGDRYRINKELVAFMRRFRDKWYDALIVIWSGGGDNYACEVMRHVGLGEGDPNFIDALPMIKDQTTFYLVRPEDYVVDDEPGLAVPCKVWTPDATSQLSSQALG